MKMDSTMKWLRLVLLSAAHHISRNIVLLEFDGVRTPGNAMYSRKLKWEEKSVVAFKALLAFLSIAP